ncbi:unnamed protein product [Trichogramma brassicae]|uniref:Uncharacterized protein n=1 Tax=Trichogramma brassicae TaxID=86971 RepID=A0A6H5HX96_9HYME|nr:unnamed protein product [Trichogramma brassicae]
MNQDPEMILACYVNVALYARVANPCTRTSRASRTSFIALTRNALGYSRMRICSRAQNRTDLSCVHGVVSSAACSYPGKKMDITREIEIKEGESSRFFEVSNDKISLSTLEVYYPKISGLTYIDKEKCIIVPIINNKDPWLERRRRKTGKIEELITSLIIILDKTLVHVVNSTVLKNVYAQTRAILILHRDTRPLAAVKVHSCSYRMYTPLVILRTRNARIQRAVVRNYSGKFNFYRPVRRIRLELGSSPSELRASLYIGSIPSDARGL